MDHARAIRSTGQSVWSHSSFNGDDGLIDVLRVLVVKPSKKLQVGLGVVRGPIDLGTVDECGSGIESGSSIWKGTC